MNAGLVLRLLRAVADDLVAGIVRGLAVVEACRPGRLEPERWARMAGVSPAAARAIVDLVEPTRCARTQCVEAAGRPVVWSDPERDPCNLDCLLGR